MTMIFNGTTGITFPDGQTQDVGVPDPGTNGNVLTSNGTIWTSAAPGTYSQWTTSGSNIYYNTGNVGIGITSPDGLITLPATASNTPKIRLQSASSDVDVTISSYADASGTYAAFGSNFYLNSSGDEAVFDSAKRSSFIRVDGRSQGAVILGTATSGVPSERMRITSNGNVGIGTSSPGANLQIGSASFAPNANLGNNLLQIKSPSGFAYITIGNGDTANSTSYIAGASGFTTIGSVTDAGSITEHMRITNTGSVGIGTTTPSSFNAAADNLVVGTNSGNNGITIVGGTTGFSSIYLADGTTGNEAFRGYIEYRHSEDAMGFGTAASERMRIDSSGNAMIGTTTSGGRLTVSTATGSYVTRFITEGNNQDYIAFVSGTNIVGSVVRVGGTNVAYNTSSDYRLKENIVPMTGALAKIQELKPCNWTWKLDGTNGQGFIAHELQKVCPDAVSGTKDEVDEDGKPKYQGVDTSFLVATLTAAIQEQQAIINELKTRIETLENK